MQKIIDNVLLPQKKTKKYEVLDEVTRETKKLGIVDKKIDIVSQVTTKREGEDDGEDSVRQSEIDQVDAADVDAADNDIYKGADASDDDQIQRTKTKYFDDWIIIDVNKSSCNTDLDGFE